MISQTAPPNHQISECYRNKCSSRILSLEVHFTCTHTQCYTRANRHSEVSRGQLKTEETTEIIIPWLYRAQCYLTCLGLFTSLWVDSDVLLGIKCLITAIYVILKDKALPQRINYRGFIINTK